MPILAPLNDAEVQQLAPADDGAIEPLQMSDVLDKKYSMAMKEHLINIHHSDIDKYIYRVMPVHRLFEVFESDQITLVQPSKWDDPFENLLLKGLINGVFERYPVSKIFRNDIYGQCWTLHRETDAMWRIYSQDKQGVKVRCTIRNLLESILKLNSDFEPKALFLGKVEYLPQKTLLSVLSTIDGVYGEDAAKSLLYKRREFTHEAEVRLISTRGNGEVQKFRIDPHEVFNEIVFDPRMNKHIFKSYSESIKMQGYKKRVVQSVLYQLPKELGKGI